MRTLPPPSIVTTPPPSMTVSMPVGSSMVWVTVMVAPVGPQSKVTNPPLVSAADRAVSVHDAAVPVPTTVVGLLTSTAWIGAVQTAVGRTTPPPSTSGGGVLASPPAPPPSPFPPAVAPSPLPASCDLLADLLAEFEDPQPKPIATTSTGVKTTPTPIFPMIQV